MVIRGTQIEINTRQIQDLFDSIERIDEKLDRLDYDRYRRDLNQSGGGGMKPREIVERYANYTSEMTTKFGSNDYYPIDQALSSLRKWVLSHKKEKVFGKTYYAEINACNQALEDLAKELE